MEENKINDEEGKMKTTIYILILFVTLFIIGCQGVVDISKISDADMQRISEKIIVCDKPYIRFASSCCLDNNNNSVCDNDDNDILVLNKSTTESEIKTSPINKTPSINNGTIMFNINDKYKLDIYPMPFIKNNKENTIFIVGNSAGINEVSSINDIAVSLVNNPQKVYLTSEINDIFSSNAIIVGTCSSNKILMKLFGSLDKCNEEINKNSIIYLLSINDKAYLIVSGTSISGVIDSSSVLSNYKDYQFSGVKLQIINDNDKLKIIKIK